MNFFSKSKVVFWSLIFLVVVLTAALVTLLVSYSNTCNMASRDSCATKGSRFRKELSLSQAQSAEVDAILNGYRKSTGPIAAGIRNCRTRLLEVLAGPTPDTAQVGRFIDEIGVMQKSMQKASADQYLALKKICTPDQCRRLSALYAELYGCQASCQGMGKGNMHQNRKGQSRHECGN